MGVHSKVWGQYLWRLLHSITYSYNPNMSDELKAKYIRFFHVLKDFIPCPICRNHYTSRIAKNPPERNMKTTNELVGWLNDLHNEVNAGLGKPLVSRKFADTYYVKDGQLTYDFKDFIILFRILVMMTNVNYPALQKFLQILFEIFPGKLLTKNAPNSQKQIISIRDNQTLNIWIIQFDNEFAKNRNTNSYLNIQLPPPSSKELHNLIPIQKEKEKEIDKNYQQQQINNVNLQGKLSKIVKNDIDDFLKKYKII